MIMSMNISLIIYYAILFIFQVSPTIFSDNVHSFDAMSLSCATTAGSSILQSLKS